MQWEGAINQGSTNVIGECAAVQPSSQSTDTCCFGGMITGRPYIFQSTLGSGSHVRYQWGGSSYDDGRFTDVIYDSSGFIVAVGYLESGTTFNPMIIRFDSTLALGTGTFTSVSTISAFSAHYSVVTDSSDNIYVGGNSNNGYETHILKYNSSGTFQWGILIRDSSGASTNNRVSCYNLGLDSDENIIASGPTSAVSGSTSDYDHMTLRYPNDGSITGTFGDFTISSVTPTAGTLSIAFANGTPTEESFSTSQTNYTQTIADRSQATISTTLTSIS